MHQTNTYRFMIIIVSMEREKWRKKLNVFLFAFKSFTKYSYFVRKFAKAEALDFPIQ